MTTAIFIQALLLGIPVGLALGLVGGGGSILTVPILIGVMGLEPKAATSASLVIVAVNAIVALRVYMREQLVQYRMAFTVTAAGLLGSIAGTWANHLISPQILTFAFVALMVLIATKMLYSNSDETSSTQPVSISRIILAGTLIGLTTGFFGVGGGFIIVPALLALGLKMRQAVPTSLLVIALNSLVALGLRMIGGANVPFAYALPIILGGVIGSSLAVRIAPKIGNLGLRRAFAALILGLATYLGMTAFSR
jgi:uncharacterized protein